MSIIAEISTRQCCSRFRDPHREYCFIVQDADDRPFRIHIHPPPRCYLIIFIYPHSQMGWAWKWAGRTGKGKTPLYKCGLCPCLHGGPIQPARGIAAEWCSHYFTSLRPWTPRYLPQWPLLDWVLHLSISCDMSRLVTSDVSSWHSDPYFTAGSDWPNQARWHWV